MSSCTESLQLTGIRVHYAPPARPAPLRPGTGDRDTGPAASHSALLANTRHTPRKQLQNGTFGMFTQFLERTSIGLNSERKLIVISSLYYCFVFVLCWSLVEVWFGPDWWPGCDMWGDIWERTLRERERGAEGWRAQADQAGEGEGTPRWITGTSPGSRMEQRPPEKWELMFSPEKNEVRLNFTFS